jgi:hypothetical protein
MAIYSTTAAQNIFGCFVNTTEEVPDGWSFALTPGFADNSLFQITGNDVQFKAATNYLCRDYSVQVTCTKIGQSDVIINQTISVKEKGMKAHANLSSGLIFNTTVTAGIVNSSATADTVIEADIYVPVADAGLRYVFLGRTAASLSTAVASTEGSANSSVTAAMATLFLGISQIGNGNAVTLYLRNASNTQQLPISNSSAFGIVRGRWYSVKITITASATPTVTLEMNGVSVTSGASSNYIFGGAQTATDAVWYLGSCSSSVSVLPLIADFKVTQNGYNVVTDPLTVQSSLVASLVGAPTFNQAS